VTKLVKYSTHLKKQAKRIKEVRSGERTRQLLMAAAAELLESTTLRDLHVSAIRKPVKASQGTFYIYFKDKYDLVAQLLRDYIEFELRTMPVLDEYEDIYDLNVDVHYWYAEMFRLNAGIMRCFIQLNDTSTEITELWQLRGEKIVGAIMEFHANRYDLSADEQNALRSAFHIMGNALDQILSSMYGAATHSVFSFEKDRGMILELYSTLMLRAVYGENPKLKTNSPAKLLTKIKFKRKTARRKSA